MDYGRYGSRRLLMKETVKNTLTPQLGATYGFHWEIFYSPNENERLPPFGHGGSDGTLAVAIPEKDIIILYFTQTRKTPSISRNILPLIKRVFIWKQ